MKSIMAQAMAGFIALFVILGLFLFLSAGTMNYLQGWFYLFSFAIPVLLITLYLFKYDKRLLESRVKAGPVAEKEKSQKIIQSLAQISFILVYVVSGLDYRFHWSQIPLNMSFLADVIVILGLFLVFLVFRENTYTSAIIEVNEDQKVISTGPYNLVRHPMYSGALALMLASPVALGSWYGLAPALGLVYVIVLRLLDEEKFLVKNLKGYAEYCQKVKYHLVPYIW